MIAPRLSTPLALLLLLGGLCSCSDGPEAVADADAPSDVADATPDADEDAPEEVAVVEPLTDWPDHVTTFPFLDDQTFEGDIADGEPVAMGWADEPGVNCWLFNIEKYFTGSQVYYAMDKPLQKASQLAITVTPAAGVDLNAYAFGLETGTFYFPPEVPAVSDCVSSRSAEAGEPETIHLQNLQAPLQWLIAVSGPEGVTEGAFTLTIARTDLMPSL